MEGTSARVDANVNKQLGAGGQARRKDGKNFQKRSSYHHVTCALRLFTGNDTLTKYKKANKALPWSS